jgi:hypothetical protein
LNGIKVGNQLSLREAVKALELALVCMSQVLESKWC